MFNKLQNVIVGIYSKDLFALNAILRICVTHKDFSKLGVFLFTSSQFTKNPANSNELCSARKNIRCVYCTVALYSTI